MSDGRSSAARARAHSVRTARVTSGAEASGGLLRGAVGLINRQIDDRFGRVGEQTVFGVACDADNSEAITVVHHLFADSVFAWPIPIDKGLIDDGDALRVSRIRFGEFPS